MKNMACCDLQHAIFLGRIDADFTAKAGYFNFAFFTGIAVSIAIFRVGDMRAEICADTLQGDIKAQIAR